MRLMSKMPAQQLLLSWKDHNGALVSVFQNLLKKNALVDCTLAAEGQYLKAHKVVLSACSSYFELLFSQESEKNPIVVLKDVKFPELEAAIDFMYKGEVEVCEERLATFLEVADSLQIKGLGSDKRSQASKEKVPAKSALTHRKQSRKEHSNHGCDNAGQSSNVPADCEQIRNDESAFVHQSSRRGSSPVLPVSTFSGDSSQKVRKRARRNSDCLENIQCSLALPSFTSGESAQTEDNPVIKNEPEVVSLLEDQSDEDERYFGDDITMAGDHDDCNNDTMDVVLSNQQDIAYPSEPIKTDDSTSENVEGMQCGNRSSSESAGWVQPEVQQQFSSVFVKEEPGTSASWDQEAVNYGASASGDEVGPSAGTSASAGMDNLYNEDNEQLTPASVLFYPRVAASCRSNVSGKSTDGSLQLRMPRPPSKKLFCPCCKELFVRMIELKRHIRLQSCGALSGSSEGELPPDDPSSPLPVKLKRTNRVFPFSSKISGIKCPECNFMTVKKSLLMEHLRIHTGEKLFKCIYCDYASGRKRNLVSHVLTHSGEKTFKCPHCDYATVRKTNLRRHLCVHTDVGNNFHVSASPIRDVLDKASS